MTIVFIELAFVMGCDIWYIPGFSFDLNVTYFAVAMVSYFVSVCDLFIYILLVCFTSSDTF